MFIQNTSQATIENLQLRDRNLSCLKISKNINYPSNLFPKIKSILLVDQIEDKLLKNINKNRELRDFLCVNIQDIGQELSKKYRKFIELKNTEGSVFVFRNFGFMNGNSIKNNDEDYYNYLKDLTLQFGLKLGFLKDKNIIGFNDDKIKGFENNLLNPFSQLLKSVGSNRQVSSKELMEVDASPKDIQNLLMAWQNKTIFERVIAKLIENELRCNVHCSKHVIINSKDPFRYSLEFDNIFVWNNRICFVELKNGSINRNDVFQFLGKVRAVENYYGFRVNKIAVIGTKPKENIFEELETKMPTFKIFDIEDYRDNFKRFFQFIKG